MVTACLSLVRRLSRCAFDDPKVTLFGVMPVAGPGDCTELSIYADQHCWRSLLSKRPDFLDLATEVLVCDTSRAVKWQKHGKEEMPHEATGCDDTLVCVKLPFACRPIFKAVAKDVLSYLVGHGMSTQFFSERATYRKPFEVRRLDFGGRETTVEMVRPRSQCDGTMETPTLYERGLPISSIDLPFHVNLLTTLQDSIPEALASDMAKALVVSELPL